MFDKVTQMYVYGGYIINGVRINDDGSDSAVNLNSGYISTSYFVVTGGDTLIIKKTPVGSSGNIFFYDSNKNLISKSYMWFRDSNNVTVPNNAAYARLSGQYSWRWEVTSNTTGDLIFKYA
jgi:hypothetical protein